MVVDGGDGGAGCWVLGAEWVSWSGWAAQVQQQQQRGASGTWQRFVRLAASLQRRPRRATFGRQGLTTLDKRERATDLWAAKF